MTKLWRKLFQLETHREEEMANQAVHLGMSYSREDQFFLKNQLSQFRLFNKGQSKKCYNVINKQELDYKLFVFDYKFTLLTGHASHTYKQSVLFIDSNKLSLPPFFQEPEYFYHRLLAYFGIDDIDFESHPEYSRKHRLTGEYEKVVRHYFTKGVLDLLSIHPLIYMEGMNYYFIIYKQHEYLPPKQIGAFIDLGELLYKLFLIQSNAAS